MQHDQEEYGPLVRSGREIGFSVDLLSLWHRVKIWRLKQEKAKYQADLKKWREEHHV
jgi:hypothetical protein